uniref:Uncharacterized protein n=1 Tax=Alexandrium monilatum TaxID=311494 RepID=A0A7S4TC51_9DINO
MAQAALQGRRGGWPAPQFQRGTAIQGAAVFWMPRSTLQKVGVQGASLGCLGHVTSRLHDDRKRQFMRTAEVQINSLGPLSAKLGEDKLRSEHYSASARLNLDSLMNTMEAVQAGGVATIVHDDDRSLNSTPAEGVRTPRKSSQPTKEHKPRLDGDKTLTAQVADELVGRLLQDAENAGPT